MKIKKSVEGKKTAKERAKERREERGIRQMLIEVDPIIHFDLDEFDAFCARENRSMAGQTRQLQKAWLDGKILQKQNPDISRIEQNIVNGIVNGIVSENSRLRGKVEQLEQLLK